MNNPEKRPLIWVLLGPKAGDNNQVLALADALQAPYQTLKLGYRHSELVSNLFLGANILGVDQSRSDPLLAPWPDLLISSGRRSEPVAQWIKKQNAGNTRLVHVGRPWKSPTRYDLVISTTQYYLQPGENILVNRLPLHRMDQQSLGLALDRWQETFDSFPKPQFAMLLGGDSGAYLHDREIGRDLGAKASKLAAQTGGSLLISSSSRTPEPFFRGVLESVQVPYFVYHWRANDPDNPYMGLLAVADQVIVTGESISMVTEAIATGKPVHIEPPPAPKGPLQPGFWRWRSVSHRITQWAGPKRVRRNIMPLLENLVEQGVAQWLGYGRSGNPDRPPDHALQRSVSAVRRLLSDR